MVSRATKKQVERQVFEELMQDEYSAERCRLDRTTRRELARRKAKLISRSLVAYQEKKETEQASEEVVISTPDLFVEQKEQVANVD